MTVPKHIADFAEAGLKFGHEVEKALLPLGYKPTSICVPCCSRELHIDAKMIDFGDPEAALRLKNAGLLEFATQEQIDLMKAASEQFKTDSGQC
jgi:hypothetical protein